jgi:hypothetical protein
MNEIYGEIENKSSKDGKKKNGELFTRYEFTINKKRYSTFIKEIGEKFKIGDYVKIEIEQQGAFWNMKNMIHADKSAFRSSSFNNTETFSQTCQEYLKKIYEELVKINVRAELYTGDDDAIQNKTNQD